MTSSWRILLERLPNGPRRPFRPRTCTQRLDGGQELTVCALGEQAGLLRDVRVRGARRVRLELALAAPVEDPAQFDAAAPAVARASRGVAGFAGQVYAARACLDLACDSLPAPPGSVLTQGLGPR